MNPHMQHDGWGAAIALWLWSTGSMLFGGLSGIQVVLMLATLVYTVIKTANEIDKRRLSREFEHRRAAADHPLRRATDQPHTQLNSNAGEL